MPARCGNPNARVGIPARDEWGHFLLSDDAIYQNDKIMCDGSDHLSLAVSAVIYGGHPLDLERLVRAHLNLFVAAGAVHG